MSRTSVAWTIVVVWLIALGWLAQRHYWRPASAVLAEAALRVPPGATYFTVAVGGRQIGFAASQLDTLRDTIRVQDLTVLQIPSSGPPQREESRTITVLTRTLELRSFEITRRGEAGRYVASGEVSGDSLLLLRLESLDGRRSLRLPLTEPVFLPAQIPLHVTFVDPPVLGKSYAFHLFDPASLGLRDIDLVVTADSTMIIPDSAGYDSSAVAWKPVAWDTLRAWRLSQTGDGQSRHMWIDELGQVVGSDSPVGYATRRTAFELAFENFQQRGPTPRDATDDRGSEIVPRTAIASGIGPPRALEELRVRVRNVPAMELGLPGTDTVMLRRGSITPAEPKPMTKDAIRSVQRYNAPGLLIESEDPRIAAQARQIVGREVETPVQAAQVLAQWVYEHVEKRTVTELPSAVGVLDSRQGDCNEHTVLFVALARALRIPARPVAGLVYIDGRFYLHAWAEVHDGQTGEWTSVDPTFGQVPADARHLRLSIGGLAGPVEMIHFLGDTQLDVIPTGDTT